MRVIAALSGGVDSAVAAARAVDAGHEVVGVHLALARNHGGAVGSRGCCTPEDARDARRVADILGIPFYVWDLSEAFERDVMADFVAEYAAGRTPNPCVRCNETIKFAAVLQRAWDLGFDAVCTGHYARILDGDDGPQLHRAVDHGKDQSYVLAVLTPQQIAGAMLPLGESTKVDVRGEAAQRGLLVADKPDSHDICFIPDGDTAGFLRSRLGERPGDIIDAVTGERLGRHDGSYAFTVGQRRGLGLTVPTDDGARRYVLAIEPVDGNVMVGTRDRLYVATITADRPRWCGAEPGQRFDADVQVRAHGEIIPARVDLSEGGVSARLVRPVRGVAPGQTLVLYSGTRVVGSATIAGSAE